MHTLKYSEKRFVIPPNKQKTNLLTNDVKAATRKHV